MTIEWIVTETSHLKCAEDERSESEGSRADREAASARAKRSGRKEPRGERPVIKTYRSVEEAREAVEHEICELLVGENPRFDPRDVYWPNENSACIGDEITWKIEPHETPTRKETTMNELKREVRDIIDNYDPDARPRDCEGCSLPHGSRTPTSGGYDFEDTILKLASVGAAPCGPCGVRFAQAT